MRPRRAYAGACGFVNRARRFGVITLLLGAAFSASALAAPKPPATKIVAFGDSLTAGLGLEPSAAFPERLAARLQKDGYTVAIENAGVSGDTTSGGLARLDWALGGHPDLVLLELGANDALRGIDPTLTRANLDAILARLARDRIKVLLIGMKAPRNWGPDYDKAFDAIYPALAKKYDVPLYPFFLDGVALDAKLNQGDGLHPNAAGVEVIVAKIAPAIERLIGPRAR
ncbi:MAG TPA: arylesterase [Stellaceae bacterium]|nr:arylesterase [Stellaceae bacterium]